MVNNARVLGSDSDQGKKLCKELYESFCKGELLLTDAKTAEFVKVVENTYRAVNIGLANELANGSLSLTLSRFTTEKEIDYVLKVLPGIITKLRRISPF